MPGDWDSITNNSRPKGFADVKSGLKLLIKANVFRHKKDDGELGDLAEQIWDASGNDADKLIEAFNATIKKHADVSYLLGCLRGHKEPPAYTPKETQKTPTKEVVVLKNKDNNNGVERTNFILLYRSLRNHPWFKKKPAWVKLFFIELCLDAAWKDHDVDWRKDKVHLKRGQWIILERKVAEEYDQSQQMVHYWLQKLEKEGMIDIKIVNFKKGKCLSENLSERLSGNLSVGSLVTICKYEEYQVPINSNLSDNLSENLSDNLSKTEECITGEGKTEDRKLVDLPEKIQITARQIFEIWEKERGQLEPVRVPKYERMHDLVVYLNSLDGKDPVSAWIEIIHKARQCHVDHRPFMSPTFFSKDLTHIDQVLNGLYDKSFSRGKNGSTKIERSGRGDAEEFGFKGGRSRRIDTLDDAEVLEV